MLLPPPPSLLPRDSISLCSLAALELIKILLPLLPKNSRIKNMHQHIQKYVLILNAILILEIMHYT